MEPLLEAMVDIQPERRPTAPECERTLREITTGLGTLSLVRPVDDMSTEWDFGGAWMSFFFVRAFLRFWIDWARLALKFLILTRREKP
jgi:hypothetical protein